MQPIPSVVNGLPVNIVAGCATLGQNLRTSRSYWASKSRGLESEKPNNRGECILLMRKGNRLLVYVLLSGGIDSTACVHFYRDLGYRVKLLHIQYGQAASVSGLRSSRAVAQFYKLKLLRVNLSRLEPAISGEIPGRNALLLSTGLVSMGARTGLIALGIHAGTRYFDCQSAFVGLWEQLLDGYTDGRIRLGTPFLGWTKSKIWQYCLSNDVPLSLTWSCESRSGRPCGRCLSCKDKEALIARS